MNKIFLLLFAALFINCSPVETVRDEDYWNNRLSYVKTGMAIEKTEEILRPKYKIHGTFEELRWHWVYWLDRNWKLKIPCEMIETPDDKKIRFIISGTPVLKNEILSDELIRIYSFKDKTTNPADGQ